MSILGKRKRNKKKTTTVTVNPNGSKTYTQTTVKSRERTTNRGRDRIRKPLPPVTTLTPYGPDHDTPLSSTITPRPITAQPIKRATKTVTTKPKVPATPPMSNRQSYRSVR